MVVNPWYLNVLFCVCSQSNLSMLSANNYFRQQREQMGICWPKIRDAKQPHPASTMHHHSDLKVVATECQRI